MAFTHLHIHTCYSLLDGASKIPELVGKAKEQGFKSLAITDHGVMYGVVDFYKECKKNDIKPILGCEVYVAPGSRFDKNSKSEEKYYHLVLLAENNTGYENLMKICSYGFTEGFYYKPRIDREILEKFHEGIIALSGCIAGELPQLILKDDLAKAKETALYYKNLFGENNYYFEIQNHNLNEEMICARKLLELGKELGIKVVCTNDSHYTLPDDFKIHDILLCIQTKSKVEDENRMRFNGNYYYLKDEKEMRNLFPSNPEVFDITEEIANRCNVEISFHDTKLPKYEVPKGYDAWSYLNELCNSGLKERYKKVTKELKDRLDYELSIIKKMGYVEYFLIVWDFINWARSKNIPVGHGRGSAAGSIASYCLGITNIDPIKYGLIFERFLNPERVSMPDVDSDICYERREEVIEYVKEKYGKDNVIQIITFGTIAARQVIKDVGKALGMSYSTTDRIAKMIPKEVGITIPKALTMVPDLKNIYNTDNEMKRLIDISIKLEGLPKQTGTHAAGVVICPSDAKNFLPLALNADKDGVVSQFTMTTVEELGLLKMDLLGLRTLTVISDAIKIIKETKGDDINIDNLDLTDKKVFSFITKGKTAGVFQLESAGMQSFMKKLKPKSVEDLIAGVSLYRPGPMDFIPKYIEGKNKPSSIVYECEELKPILKNTYGCIVYQEQVMQIFRELAGYTMGQADNIRRAMSKKKQKVIDDERKSFVFGDSERGIKGCVNNGISETAANRIYDSMTDFAKYAFNKSHAAAYALIGYQTAWLKCYYPVEYTTATMSSVIDNKDLLVKYINEAKSEKMVFKKPDINIANAKFSTDGKKIVYALGAIKNISVSFGEKIKNEREVNGVYKSFTDFISRNIDDVDKTKVLNLVKAGAFDNFGFTKHSLENVCESFVKEEKKKKKDSISGQLNLFDLEEGEDFSDYENINIPKLEEFNEEMLLQDEKEVLGVYISGHPLSSYSDMIKAFSTTNTIKLEADENENFLFKEGEIVTLCGMLFDIKKIYTKEKSEEMAFASLEDEFGKVDLVIFPKIFKKARHVIFDNSKVMVKGSVSIKDGELSILCNEILGFNEVPRRLWLRFNTMNDFLNAKVQIDSLCQTHQGNNGLILIISDTKKMNVYSYVNVSKSLVKAAKLIVGNDNAKVTYP